MQTPKVLKKKTGRKAPSTETLRRLFALSGNQCAKPGCPTVLLSANGTLVGEVAHIAAESSGGPRFDSKLDEAGRRAFENLLLLCSTCHTLVDKEPKTYTKDILRKWKRDREARFEAVGDLLRKSYLNEITDDADVAGASLPQTLNDYVRFLVDQGDQPFIDGDTPADVAAYVERLRHLAVADRQLMLAIIEKAMVLGGARETEHGISVHPDDLKTIRINNSRLSDYRIGKLGKTLERNGLGSLDVDDGEPDLFISCMHIDMGWSTLNAYLEGKGATLGSLLLDLKFGLLD